MKENNHILELTLLSLLLLNPMRFVQAKEIDPTLGVAAPDGLTIWYDGERLPIEGKGWMNTESYYARLPAKAKGVAPESVWNLSYDSAGLCFHFITDATAIQVRWILRDANLAMPHMPATGVSGVDLYGRDDAGKWRFIGNGRPASVSNNATFRVTPERENILYLPLYNGVTSIEIGIPKENILSTPDPSSPSPIKPIVFYGTSITQGGCASRPGMAATAIVGRELQISVINLGFSGSGKMEPEMAELLAELDPSIYILDCLWNMNLDMVKDRIEPFVKTLRKTHPNTPILLAEDSSVKNITPTEKGRILRSIYEKLTNEGMKNLYFLSNEGMLGEDFDGTVDGCHPNDLGMKRQADVFVKSLKAILQAPAQ